MAKAKRGGKSHEGYYAKYKSTNKEALNRKITLEKLAKEQPNNAQITAALKDIKHRRHTPKAPFWSHDMIRVAKLVKYFSGKFDKSYFSVDPKVQHAAAMTQNKNKFVNPKEMPVNGSMFSLGNRTKWN